MPGPIPPAPPPPRPVVLPPPNFTNASSSFSRPRKDQTHFVVLAIALPIFLLWLWASVTSGFTGSTTAGGGQRQEQTKEEDIHEAFRVDRSK